MVCVAGASALLSAQVPGSTTNVETRSPKAERRLIAVKTTEKITIDGQLDEPAWLNAPVATDFTQSVPQEGASPSEETEFRVLYDSDNLYVGVFAHDSNTGSLVINELEKDFSLGPNDLVEVVLDTFRDGRNGYEFAVNPGGAKWDAQMANEGRESNESWDGVWTVKTKIVDGGWVAELAIAFKTLKFRNADVQTWGINFQRLLRRRNEETYWSPIPRMFSLDRVS